MKYTIEGYSQEVALMLELDATDLVFLRWFMDFKETSLMDTIKTKDGQDAYWVHYINVAREMPILFGKHPTKKDGWSNLTNSEQTKEIKKWEQSVSKKVQRLLNGNLSKVLKRHEILVDCVDSTGKKKSNGKISKIYLSINKLAYRLLCTNTNFENDYMEKQVKTVNNSVDNTVDTDVDKSKTQDGQKCPTSKNVQDGQKCPTSQDGQKCPTDYSINIPYSSIRENTERTTITELEFVEEGVVCKDNGIYYKNGKRYNPHTKTYMNEKLHNGLPSRFLNYKPHELEQMLLENQKDKFK